MIDAHQHVWRIGRNDCTWPPPELAPIHRDFELSELIAKARPLGIEGSVLVQSQPSVRDTDYLLSLAEREPFVRAVVGWLDLASSHAPAEVAALARRPKLRGVRPMLQAMEATGWILQPHVQPALAALVDARLSLDALIQPRHLPIVAELADRWPALAIIVDHAAKPPIAQGAVDPWSEQLGALAERPNVACKLSGLLTEASPGQGREALKPYAARVLAAFGPERTLWGGDWPVIELSAPYARWLEIARSLVAELAPGSEPKVFGDTARAVYRIKERGQ